MNTYNKNKGKIAMSGRYRDCKTNAISGEVISRTPWIENPCNEWNSNGRESYCRLLGNDNTYSLAITKCKIGTGTTSITSADTDIESVGDKKTVLQIRLFQETLSRFLSSIRSELPNGTYTEFAIFTNQIFARSIISPHIQGNERRHNH